MHKKKFLFLLSFFIFFVVAGKISNGQTYGKLYPKTEGKQLYGTVVKSFQFSTEEVLSFLNKTDKVLMFNINKDKLFILGNGRKVIYPAGAVVSSKEVFSVFSTSIIRELISKGNSNMVYFEKRNSVLTISNGDYLLEMGLPCPPVCP